MATEAAIKRAFGSLVAAGSRPPATWEAEDDESRERARKLSMETYARTLPLDDPSVARAIDVWLCSPRARWWPTPGELMALVPRRADTPTAAPQADWPGARWAALTDGQLRVRLLGQATAECRCRPDCRALLCPDCERLVAVRLDELAEEAGAAAA